MSRAVVSWSCADPHVRDEECGAVVCLGEEPEALDTDGHVRCAECRQEVAS